MGSSFLTAVNVLLALYCMVNFVRLTFQFGLPNHPSRFSMYFVVLCPTAYYTMFALTHLNLMNPYKLGFFWALPIIAGSLALLLQVIISLANFTHLQQKIMSRFPIIISVISFFLMREYAAHFFVFSLCAIVLILTVSVGKARYQKRMLFKMCLFFALYLLCDQSSFEVISLTGQLFLFPAWFYFFVFEQTVGVSALVDRHISESSEVSV